MKGDSVKMVKQTSTEEEGQDAETHESLHSSDEEASEASDREATTAKTRFFGNVGLHDVSHGPTVIGIIQSLILL